MQREVQTVGAQLWQVQSEVTNTAGNWVRDNWCDILANNPVVFYPCPNNLSEF